MVSQHPASALMDSLGGPLYREIQSVIASQKEAAALLRRLLDGGESEHDIIEYFGDDTVKHHVAHLLDAMR